MNDTHEQIERKKAEMARQKMLINEARVTIQRLDVIKPIALDPERVAIRKRWLAHFASLVPVLALCGAFMLTMAAALVPCVVL